MQERMRTLVPLLCVAALSACGGGGGATPVSVDGFTSWSALRPGTTSTLVAMTREADYAYDPDTELLTFECGVPGRDRFEPDAGP